MTMSSDENMVTDMDQAETQSTTQSNSQLEPSFSSNSQIESNIEPWGQIVIHKITRKRLGMRCNYASFSMQKVRTFDLVREQTTFGQKADCNISDLIDKTRLQEISRIHFSIIKDDVGDPLCPIFLEDSSTNGTYFRQFRKGHAMKFTENNERIDEKIKRRIIAHREMIYIEKRPTICFEFQSFQLTANNLSEDLNREYHIGKELGSGASGVVKFAQNRKTCECFALKFTRSDNENSANTMIKEAQILKKLKHPCIMQLYKLETYVDSVAILIDLMAGGDLFSRITSGRGYFSENYTKFIFYQICCGVEYLHENGVTHRDLKPENILLATKDKYTLVKVADFGLSKCVSQNTNPMLQTQCGTRNYLAPEVLTGRYNNKVDIWSIGVILYNCLCGSQPQFDSASENYNLRLNGTDHWHYISDEGKDIVRETLRYEAENRPSAKMLLTQRNWLSTNDKSVKRALDTINKSQQ